MQGTIEIEGQKIKITNPEKVLWPKLKIRKIDYIKILLELSPYLIPYTSNRFLTTIRFPDGVSGKSFYQKKATKYTPQWIDLLNKEEYKTINLNKLSTLIWLGNQACLEFHTTFDLYKDNLISNLVFDLDPSKGQNFDDVIEAALIINDELTKLKIESFVKTSGSSGLQIYIPIEKKYTFEEGRLLNKLFGEYFAQKYSNIFTIERSIKNRKNLLYFDYLQMWKGKTIISVYSPRAVESAAVSTPITWQELKNGIKPQDFNLLNIISRLKGKGDIFKDSLNSISPNMNSILKIYNHLNIKS